MYSIGLLKQFRRLGTTILRPLVAVMYLSFSFIIQDAHASMPNFQKLRPGHFELYDAGDKLYLNIQSGNQGTAIVIEKALALSSNYEEALTQYSGTQFVIHESALVAEGDYNNESSLNELLSLALTPFFPDGIPLKSGGKSTTSSEPSTGAQVLAGAIIVIIALGSLLVFVLVVVDAIFNDFEITEKAHKKLSLAIDEALEDELENPQT